MFDENGIEVLIQAWSGTHGALVDGIDDAEQTARVSEEDYVIIKRLGQALSAFGENFLLHKSVAFKFPNFSRFRKLSLFLDFSRCSLLFPTILRS
jgi:hypothetical protein